MSNSGSIGELGELGFISRLRKKLGKREDIIVGAGDDCAVVRTPGDEKNDIVLKSDPIICGRHFLADTPGKEVGHKAIGRVLSDIAAMGAQPLWCLVDLVVPENTSVEYLDDIYEGVVGLANQYGCMLVGGDTCKGDTLELHVFGCGTLPRDSAKLRSAAKPADTIYVTGKLGGSFEIGRHLNFEPRVKEGMWLRNRANAMIDISDGLASEIWHIAEESKVMAFIATPLLPLSEGALAKAEPYEAALFDGEDFELLFTIPPEDVNFNADWAKAFPDVPCTPIGMIGEYADMASVKYESKDGNPLLLPKNGFDHFKTKEKSV